LLAVLLLATLALSACSVIPASDSFDSTANFNTYVCTASTDLRTLFLVIGMFFAVIGISGYALKQLAPSVFAQVLGGIEGQVGKIIMGGLVLGFGPGVVIAFFVAMGATGC
jgi:hypothetical protein